MRGLSSIVRRALLAALIIAPVPAAAEVVTMIDGETGLVSVSGLGVDERAQLLRETDRLQLRVAGLESARSMLVSLSETDSDLVVTPRFPLQPGTDYVLSLRMGTETHRFDVALDVPDAPVPTLVGFAPSQSIIPANTLRLYLQFSEPMARGQVRELVSLLRSDGSAVPSPFLTLGPELWDPTQTRVTLLFDPGRLKQGVGPNAEVGPPLEEGETYRLIVSGVMESALGAQLGEDVQVTLRVGPPELRAIDPTLWQVLAPPSGSQAPLTVAFDRILDRGATQRLLILQDPAGHRVQGTIESDGGGWSLMPETPWTPGTYTLIVDVALEDVAGNRPGAPFDAEAGTIGVEDRPVRVPIDIIGG